MSSMVGKASRRVGSERSCVSVANGPFIDGSKGSNLRKERVFVFNSFSFSGQKVQSERSRVENSPSFDSKKSDFSKTKRRNDQLACGIRFTRIRVHT